MTFTPEYEAILAKAHKRWPAIAEAAEHPLAEWLALEGTQERKWRAEFAALGWKLPIVTFFAFLPFLLAKWLPKGFPIAGMTFSYIILFTQFTFSAKSDPGRMFELRRGIEARPENAHEFCLLPIRYSTVLAGVVLNSLCRRPLTVLFAPVFCCVLAVAWAIDMARYGVVSFHLLPALPALVLSAVAVSRIVERIRVCVALHEAGGTDRISQGGAFVVQMVITCALFSCLQPWFSPVACVCLLWYLRYAKSDNTNVLIDETFKRAVEQEEIRFLALTRAMLEVQQEETSFERGMRSSRTFLRLWRARVDAWFNDTDHALDLSDESDKSDASETAVRRIP